MCVLLHVLFLCKPPLFLSSAVWAKTLLNLMSLKVNFRIFCRNGSTLSSNEKTTLLFVHVKNSLAGNEWGTETLRANCLCTVAAPRK